MSNTTITNNQKFYIGGQWVSPLGRETLDVINPATEEVVDTISLGNSDDVDRAVTAAREGFQQFRSTSVNERLALLEIIAAEYRARMPELAQAITLEMGAPSWFAQQEQAAAGLDHIEATIRALKTFKFEVDMGSTRLVKEGIGVCGLITPWNWPMNQLACKVAPAIAAGCTMVVKPSEVAPLSAHIFAEVLDRAGTPAGVFNLIDGDGSGVGDALSRHADIDMVSFTGSTRAGIAVAKSAADTVKRVSQELGGKSANILLDDVKLEEAVAFGVSECFLNSGQSCNAPTRMFVPETLHDEAVRIAKSEAAKFRVGDTLAPDTMIGPVVSKVQWDNIQALITAGIEEGAELICGGAGYPEEIARGYYVRPTIFANVRNSMRIARDEIFGPVLCILPYSNLDDAIKAANDSPYGLSGYVSSGDLSRARAVAAQLRTGMVHLNGAPLDSAAPFGGYKQSGNGREWGAYGIEEFLETKAVMGYSVA